MDTFLSRLSPLLLLFLVLLNPAAASTEELRALFDEHHYALSVEWDQRDESFRLLQEERFASSLRSLRSRGVGEREFLSYLETEYGQGLDLERGIDLNLLSEEDAIAYLTEVVRHSYQEGAQWSPQVRNLVVSGLVLGAFYLLREIAQ